MSVREDCRHYSTRTLGVGEVVQRCRLSVNENAPFACPDGCVFFEPRTITGDGWLRLERATEDPSPPVDPSSPDNPRSPDNP